MDPLSLIGLAVQAWNTWLAPDAGAVGWAVATFAAVVILQIAVRAYAPIAEATPTKVDDRIVARLLWATKRLLEVLAAVFAADPDVTKRFKRIREETKAR